MQQTRSAPSFSSGIIKFLSLNCKGLNNPIKSRKVFHYLCHSGAHIIYLQEKHTRVSDGNWLRWGWTDQVYTFSFSGKLRGVAILIHKDIPFFMRKQSLIQPVDSLFF